MGKLAIITGFGALAEEVTRLAQKSQSGFVSYTIKPWLPLISTPLTALNIVHTHFKSLQPFRFTEIEGILRGDGIDRVFLIGNFPSDRFMQLSIRRMLGDIVVNADDRCRDIYYGISEKLSEPAQYFTALEKLMLSIDIQALKSREVFPELNVPPQWTSNIPVPDAVLKQLPVVIRILVDPANRSENEQIRPSQAVVADTSPSLKLGIVCQEKSGTDEMLKRYARMQVDKEMPYLVKLPSSEFNCAFDEPTIGPTTVLRCRAAGIKGIIICSSATRVVSRDTTLQMINDNGMFFHDVSLTELARYVNESHADLPR